MLGTDLNSAIGSSLVSPSANTTTTEVSEATIQQASIGIPLIMAKACLNMLRYSGLTSLCTCSRQGSIVRTPRSCPRWIATCALAVGEKKDARAARTKTAGFMACPFVGVVRQAALSQPTTSDTQ